MATKNVPAKAAKTDVANWATMMRNSAAKQQKAAEALTSGSATISFRGGVLSVGGMERRSGEVRGIVLCVMNERCYYEGDYDPDEPRTPICYAYGEVDGVMPVAPHEESTEPQADACKGCPHAEFGSAEKGRGQACRQHVKFAFLPFPEKGEPDLDSIPIYFGRIPPTSLKAAKVYLDFLGTVEEPTFSRETLIECRPSTKTILTVTMTPGEEQVPTEWRSIIMTRVQEAQVEICKPFPIFEEDAPKPAAKKKAGAAKKRF